MGTRHLICVVKDEDYKVAQYGQCDGYPSGQGVDILQFLRNEFNRELFVERLELTFQPDDEQINAMNAQLAITGKSVAALYPSMSRDTGSDILDLVQTCQEPLPLSLDLNFAADSLFCEWAYVIDLDQNTFEVFKGFNKTPLAEGDRFYGLSNTEDTSHRRTQYFPVRLRKAYPLDALPTIQEFLAELEPRDDE